LAVVRLIPGWDTAKKAKKLPILLEGEVLANQIELTDDDKDQGWKGKTV